MTAPADTHNVAKLAALYITVFMQGKHDGGFLRTPARDEDFYFSLTELGIRDVETIREAVNIWFAGRNGDEQTYRSTVDPLFDQIDWDGS